MQALRASIPHADAVSLLLAGSLCVLPFLLPYHQHPVLSFQAEWVSASLGAAAMLVALMGKRHSAFVALPVPALWLIAFAVFLGTQAFLGRPAYPQMPLLGALYALYAALLTWLGARLGASVGTERAAGVLAACLLAGALANAALGVIQFYGRPALLEDFIADLPPNPLHIGAYGNIAQANLYANYLALGASALLFLWQRYGLRTVYALAAAALLAWAGALSGSRSSLLYILWFAGLALVSTRMPARAESRRLKFAAFGLAGMMLAALIAVPWLNGAFHLGPTSQGAFERLAAMSSEHTGARGPVWILALRIFAAAPIAGAGIGEFAGAAFELGLAPEMARGEVWTSPHNLPLHLLAETGAVGAFLALAGLIIWCWQTGRRYYTAPQPLLWWIIAAVGIELIHSMFEFPLWNAHFLGVTALLIGLGTVTARNSDAGSRLGRMAAAAICAILVLALGVLLRDYLRLDATRATGTSLTLASPADRDRDAAVMRELTRGPLAPLAELWMFLGAPLDRNDLAARVQMSARVARYYPANAVVVRRAALLAFDGQADEARRLLLLAMRSFPHRCKASVVILQQAYAADRAAIEPLLALAGNSGRRDCT